MFSIGMVKKAVKKRKNSKKISKKKPTKKKSVKKSPRKILKKVIKRALKKKVAKQKKTVKTKTKTPKKVKQLTPIQQLKISEEKVKNFISDLIGSDAIIIVDILLKENNVSEFLIAEKLKISINQFRKIIYKLDNYSLVNSIRKKDKQKGWYIYYWSLDPTKLEDLYWATKRKRLDKLKERLKEEEDNDFYICQNKCERLDLERTMEHDFRCPECGKLLEQDKSKIISKIKKEIESLEKELEELNNPT